MRTRTSLLGLGLLLGASAVVSAQTSYPMLMRVEPTALRRGETVKVTVNGAGSFSGASALLFARPGLSAVVKDEPAAKPKSDAMKKGGGRGLGSGQTAAEITVAKDARLGPCEFRVVTPQGVSSLGQFVIVDEPVAPEGDEQKNNTIKGATPIVARVAVAGKIGVVEDVDWFKVEAKAGENITAEVLANRLENKIHDLQTHFDPILILHAADGRELASNDNGRFADPALTFPVKETGVYYLELRDTGYAGNANWTYVMQVTTGPAVFSVFPNAVNPGKKAELSLRGVGFDPKEKGTLALADVPSGPSAFPLELKEGLTWPVPVVVTKLPVATESGDAPAEKGQAQAVSLPCALSGRLGAALDADRYVFEAKKGKNYTFDIHARRIGSDMDPIARILNDKDQVVTEVDDTRGLGKDARIDWTAPADGKFTLEVADLHGRGGDAFGYAALMEEARPDFVLTADPDKINAGPGSRAPVFVKVDRRAGFAGPVEVTMKGLPAGMSASPLTIGPDMTQGVIVVETARDAKHSGALVQLIGKGKSAEVSAAHDVIPEQEIYMPGGGRSTYKVDTMAATVTDPSDIEVEAGVKEITLKPGEKFEIPVTIKRRSDYDKPVNLAINLAHLGSVFASPLPKGVTVVESGSKTLLGPKETKGKIIIKAADDAPACDGVPITVMGHVSINFVVKTAYCTAPIKLSVKREPARTAAK